MHFYTVSHTATPNSFAKVGSLYQAMHEIQVYVRGDNGMIYKFTILPGFRTDGGSVPKAFQWFVPSWSEGNVLINLAYAIHDLVYGAELMARSEADDLLRGMLRDAGLSRARASTVCWAVNTFACRHYGKKYDRWDCALFSRLEIAKAA